MFDSIRYAIRALRREPAFTIPAVLTLMLGIGANIAVFSAVESVLLRPLPYPGADRIVLLRHHDLKTDVTKAFVDSNDFLDLIARQHVFEAMVPYTTGRRTVYGLGDPIDVQTIQAGASLFRVSGVEAQLGRGLTPDDSRPGAEPVMLVSDAFWRQRLNADPSVIGRSLTLDTLKRRIVGIAPAGFNFPPADRLDIIVPMSLPATIPVPRTAGEWVFAAGRLRTSATVHEADTELRALSAQLAIEFSATNTGTEYFGLAVRDAIVGDTRAPLLLLLGAVSVVLVIALSNVGNLLLVRTISRRGELAIRLALGATRSQIFLQLLVENLLLTLVSGVAGVTLAVWGTSALVNLIPKSARVASLSQIGISPWIITYALAIVIGAALLFTVFAATWVDRQGAARALVSQTRHSMSRGTKRAASVLVITEVALAVVLLIGAGLIARSFRALLSINPGFDRNGVSVLTLQLPSSRYSQSPAQSAFYSAALAELRSTPNVSAVGAAVVTPLTGNNWTIPFIRVDRSMPPGQRPPNVGWQVASGGYFESLKIPLRSGRLFDVRDATGPTVVIVSESVERKYFDRGEVAVGHRVKVDDEEAEIVGVVGDIRRAALVDEPRADMYLPFEKFHGDGATLFLRSRNGAPADLGEVRAEIRRIEPNVRFDPVTTLNDVAKDSAASTRLVMWLLGMFGTIAMLLSAIGIYGVLSYVVRQRLREFATRVAIGASGTDILWLVMRQGLATVSAGLAIGVAIALPAGRLLRSLLFSVTSHDGTTFAIGAALLFVIAGVGCYLPARRASRIAPSQALVE